MREFESLLRSEYVIVLKWTIPSIPNDQPKRTSDRMSNYTAALSCHLSLWLCLSLSALSSQVTWAWKAEATHRTGTKYPQNVKEKIFTECTGHRFTVSCTVLALRRQESKCSEIQLNWGFFSVLAWRWLHWLLDCLWLLFHSFCLWDTVSWQGQLLLLLLQHRPPSFLKLFLFLHLLLRFGSLHLQEAKLYSQLNDGLTLLMNRLVQMVILNLDPAKREKGSLELYTQPATDGTNESLIRHSSLHLSWQGDKRGLIRQNNTRKSSPSRSEQFTMADSKAKNKKIKK